MPLASSRTRLTALDDAADGLMAAVSLHPSHWHQRGRSACKAVGPVTCALLCLVMSQDHTRLYAYCPRCSTSSKTSARRPSFERALLLLVLAAVSTTEDQWALSLGCYIANLGVALARQEGGRVLWTPRLFSFLCQARCRR